MPSQKPHPLSKADQAQQKGFTFAEKWVIWAVFCLLIGLSSDLLIFPGLLLLSYSMIILRRAFKTKRTGSELWLGGFALLASALMFWWAIFN